MPFVLSSSLSFPSDQSHVFDKKLIRAHLWVPDGTPVSWPVWQPFINDAASVKKEKIHRSHCVCPGCAYTFVHDAFIVVELHSGFQKYCLDFTSKGDMWLGHLKILVKIIWLTWILSYSKKLFPWNCVNELDWILNNDRTCVTKF